MHTRDDFRRVDIEEHEIMETKVCTSCGKQKAVSDFHRFGKDESRVGKWCEECYTRKGAGKPASPPKPAQP